ncbi:hypothetical protein [Nannocystis punicea]|uniref:Uncharacterized protein n=1 Tax=Nannocystis punicea TaxID=2995304 RepID=A0ABY7H804_9BACT|nr:hypothetical protein [Nannocystis poenicansa]WAS95399.1 hypothetical protein O0S08_04500 [Nannocystis poenicansa]
MDVHRLRNLTFLMSLGGLSAACFNDEGPHEDGAGPGGTTDTTGTTTTGGLDGDTTTTSGDALSTTTAADTSTGEPLTSTTSTGEPDTTTTEATTIDGATTTDGATTGPGPDGQVCLQYGAKYVECYPQYARFAESVIEGCESLVEKGEEVDGPACGQAFEEFFACITSLECRQIDQEFNTPMFCVGPLGLIEEFCPITGEDF